MEKPKSKEKIKSGFSEFIGGIREFFVELIDLRPGLDRWGTITRIRDNKEMKGANAWLLMCSIMVASVGLDLNSQAVIIGAMLISPLMSPILGIGLAIGINDRDMLSVSIKHFGIAIGIALATSFLYFKFTPLGSYTEQIDARTAPTFLDVLIAFFGGIAGIVSGSRKDQSNAIPGVAIATALMPPLCVTGYGLANFELEIALKSFYLFFLNTIFVAGATYLVVQLLKFPNKEFVDAKAKKRTQYVIATVSLLLLIPSITILVNVVKTANSQRLVKTHMNKHFSNAIWDFENERSPDNDTLGVILFLPGQVEEDSLEIIRRDFGTLNCLADLKIVRTSLPQKEFNKEEFRTSMTKEVMQLLKSENTVEDEKDREIRLLKTKLDSLKSDPTIFKNVSKEAQAIFPDLEEIAFAKMQQTDFDTTLKAMPTWVLKWDKKKTQKSRNRDQKIIYNWIKLRAELDTLQIVTK